MNEMDMYTQAQRCRQYFGSNWLAKIRPEFHPELITTQVRLGAPSRMTVLALHIRHQLGRMARA